MPNTEYLLHPLVHDFATQSPKEHMQYTMLGARDLLGTVYTDANVTPAAPNNSQCQFDIITSPDNIYDRELLLEVKVRVQATTGAFGDYFAPKQWPLARAMNNITMEVNNSTLTSQPSQYFDVLARHKTSNEFFKKYRSLSPSEPDAFNRYENYSLAASYAGILAGGDAGGAGPDVSGTDATWESKYSPFAPHGTFADNDDYMSRGAFPFESTTNNATVDRTYTFTEPLLHPFCMQSEGHGLPHLTKLRLLIQWQNSLAERMFCTIKSRASPHMPGAVANSVFDTPWSNIGGTDQARVLQGGGNWTANIISARLIAKSVTPDIPIEPRCDISYNDLAVYTQNIGQVNPAKNVVFNTITLSSVPSHIYIWARPQLSTATRYQADAFLRFDSLSITMMNRNSILAGMTPQQLYLMSSDNGLNMSWPQFNQFVGSPLCLQVGKDIPDLKPGEIGQLLFSFNAQLTNTTYFDHSFKSNPAGTADHRATNTAILYDHSINWELCVLFASPAVLTVAPNSAVPSIGYQPVDIEQAKLVGPSVYSYKDAQELIGGSLGSVLKRNFRKAKHFVKRHIRDAANLATSASTVIPQLAPYAKGIDTAATMMGTGMRVRGRGLLKN